MLSVVLAFFFGYLLTFGGVRRAGLDVPTAVRTALAADTVSILIMEVVDNGFLVLWPGAMDATLADVLFWVSLAASLAIAFVVTVPVNHWMIGRGRGHAVVHEMHQMDEHHTTETVGFGHAPAWIRRRPAAPAAGSRGGGRVRALRRVARRPPTRAAAPASCAKADLPLLKSGTLTIGTDSPAYEPVVRQQRPDQRQGLRVRRGVRRRRPARLLPRTRSPGSRCRSTTPTPGREELRLRHQPDLDHARPAPRSSTSPTATTPPSQAVIALKGTAGAEATSLDDLKGLRLGAQTGTTSLTAIRDVIQPDQDPVVFEDTNAAKQALQNDQVDAILADLPTAFYITAVEIPNSTIVGQFQPETGQQEEFGMLFEKGSGLVPCVNEALATLQRATARSTTLEKKWLSDVVDVPDLQ